MPSAWGNLKKELRIARAELQFAKEKGFGAQFLTNEVETLDLILRSAPPGPSTRRAVISMLEDCIAGLDECSEKTHVASSQNYIDSVTNRLVDALHSYGG